VKALDILAALTVVVLWGVNFVAIKIGVAYIPPMLLTALRFVVVAAILAPFFRPSRTQLPGILLVSFTMGVLHFGLLFLAIKGVDAATAAIATQLSVPFSAILAAVFYADRLGWRRGLGMALAFGGVALLAGEPQRPDPLSIALIAVAALAWAASNILIKRLGKVDALALNGWIALFAAPQLLAISFAVEQDQLASLLNAGWTGVGSVAYTAIASSVIAYSLWYRLLARHDINQVVPFTLLGPVVGVVAGILMLGEPLTWHKVAGGILTIGGVAIIQLRQMRRRKAEESFGTPA
jgi:O-acetylserine/cysteine efflux transporter